MAVTINNFSGCETGGLEELSAESGTQASSTSPRSGSYFYLIPATGVNYAEFTPFSIVADAGTGQGVGFAIAIRTSLTPASSFDFYDSRDSGGGQDIRLRLKSNGDLALVDAAGTEVDTYTPSLTVDVYFYLTMYWVKGNSASAEVKLDGTTILSATATDFDAGGTADIDRFANISAGESIEVDDYYRMSGLSGISDLLGEAEVFKYQSTKASATPDDGGGNLNTGNWGDAGETPLDNVTDVAIYTSTGAGAVDSDNTNGSPEGPNNDSRIDGDSNIKAIKGIWNMKRGTGGGAAHYGLLGNDADGTTRTADFDPPTAYANYFMLSEAAGIMPLSTEYCRIGFETTGAQDFNCGDMWATLLHVPSAGATTKTKTLSADSLLKKQNILLTASADSLLQKLGIEKTLSADALLVKTIEKMLSADALLQGTATKTISADALLQILNQTITAQVDALLQKQGIEITTSADALLLKNTLLTISADALLQAIVTKTFSADAILISPAVAGGVAGSLGLMGVGI